jgi:arsenate reductase
MAEALLRAIAGHRVAVFSAGSQPSAVHPLATRALAEMGIDPQGQHSKHLDEFSDQRFDFVITVCDRVREVCPVFPEGTTQFHWSFPDPAAVEGTVEARYQAFQETAAALATRVRHFFITLNQWNADRHR